jgi:allantoinase
VSKLVPDYLDYPLRRPGNDHGRFPHRYLAADRPVAWPGGRSLLLWITIHAEHFPMDMPAKPFMPLGGMDRPAPSVWDYSTRDYGNRLGIFRIMRVLDRLGLKASVAMNSVVAARYPFLVEEIVRRGWEIVASGTDMGRLHHGGLPEETERGYVQESFATLRRISGQPVEGWHSPAHSQSQNTPELVAEAGASFIADWINDDMPYPFTTARGPLVHLPLSYDLSDRKIFHLHNQTMAEYEHQIGAAFDVMLAEARARGGRILSLSLSPWVIGMPSRIATLDRLLSRFAAEADVGSATGQEIVSAWRAGQAGS